MEVSVRGVGVGWGSCLALCFLLNLTGSGCAQRIDEGVAPDPGARNYLRLEGFTQVEPDVLRGYLRWVYYADDPERVDEPRVACEVWESLELETVEPTEDCSSCSQQYEGTATVYEDTTCDEVGWASRALSLAYSPIAEASPPASDYSQDGYTHVVGSRWSPDVGEGEAFEPLFVAEPDAWDPDHGLEGTGAGDDPSGQYRLFGLYYWDL